MENVMTTRAAWCRISMLELPLTSLGDVDVATVTVRTWAHRIGAPKQVQRELALIASEAGSNAVIHGGGGHATFSQPERRMLKLVVVDRGPGIREQALPVNGYSKHGRVGLSSGLAAIQQLSDVFELHTLPGGGTTLIAVKHF